MDNSFIAALAAAGISLTTLLAWAFKAGQLDGHLKDIARRTERIEKWVDDQRKV